MEDFWKAKLAAWTHDPPEKAFVLMRRKNGGHEDGTVESIRQQLGIESQEFDRHSDWISAGADRPKFPGDKRRYPWSNVRWLNQPELVHPLTGEVFTFETLRDDIPVEHIEANSFDHFKSLIERRPGGDIDYALTHLAFWRFGSEPALVAPTLGAVWQKQPADSRVPDHSIWQHLDLVSAIAGARQRGTVGLLAMSFGPVQGFIAQARRTLDLWAGSHLLSSLVWEGLSVLCEELGPEAVIQPNLRGIAAVDRWILDRIPTERQEEWRNRFRKIDAPFLEKKNDDNPLFAATIPNKFVAIVPFNEAEDLAKRIVARTRSKAMLWAREAAEAIFELSAIDTVWGKQIEDQLGDFPEVSWSLADWPMRAFNQSNGMPDGSEIQELKRTLSVFYPIDNASTPGFFGETAWQVLQKEIPFESLPFYEPNAGILYPAVYEIAERSLASAKACRPFRPLKQEGFRCTLCGEREWLTSNREVLIMPRGKRRDTAWTEKVGKYGIKDGEHLCGLCTLKRLWPRLFSKQISSLLDGQDVGQFVVSTHTMAIATSLEKALRGLGQAGNAAATEKKKLLAELSQQNTRNEQVALPKKLMRRARELQRQGVLSDDEVRTIKGIPALLDNLQDDIGGESQGETSTMKLVQDFLGENPETYYALIKMDGDRMGAWLAGQAETSISYLEAWHTQVRSAMAELVPGGELRKYIESKRSSSPARHSAISSALNDFSGTVVRHVVEECYKGLLIYAGGDDVLAMLPVDDLLPGILSLRAAYSGIEPRQQLDLSGLRLKNGFAHLNDRVFTMMGGKATASIGAVIAHHQSPLTAVLRDLEEAVRGAKAYRSSPGASDRNGFCIRIQKRSGGEIVVRGNFDQENGVLSSPRLVALMEMKAFLTRPEVSRRAVYNSLEWLRMLPEKEAFGVDWKSLVATNLAFQLRRQSSGIVDIGTAQKLSNLLVKAAIGNETPCRPENRFYEDGSSDAVGTKSALVELLISAEFFARETRNNETH